MKLPGKLLALGLTWMLLALAFQQAAQLRFLYPTTSLRFDAPLEASRVEQARAYGASFGGPAFTFWTERTVWVSAGQNGGDAVQITFDGEPELALPVEYRFGRAPVNPEAGACAVSTGLAWALWGGEDVVGLTLTVEDVQCRVTGVFRDDGLCLLRPDSTGFTAAELQNVPTGEDAYRLAAACARDGGLGEPAEILWGSGFAAWAGVLPWLPVLLAAARLAVWAIRKVRGLSSFRRSALGFGLAFLLAFLMPGILERIPAWLLPTRWGDFAFWSRLGETLLERCRDFLSLTPTARDVAAKLAMLKEFSAVLGACVLSGTLYRGTEKGDRG